MSTTATTQFILASARDKHDPLPQYICLVGVLHLDIIVVVTTILLMVHVLCHSDGKVTL